MSNNVCSEVENFFEIKHPVLRHKVSLLRDIKTDTKLFKELVHEIAMLLAYEATRDIELQEAKIETPLEAMKGVKL